MKLNKNTWHAKWWLMNHDELPNTLCPYFWGLVLLLFKLPFSWVGYMIPDLRDRNLYDSDDKTKRVALTVLVYGFLFIGYSFSEKEGFNTSALYTLINTVLFTLALIAVLAAFVGLGFLCFYISDKASEYRATKRYERNQAEDNPNLLPEPKRYIVVEWYKGFINKYCPRIEWQK